MKETTIRSTYKYIQVETITINITQHNIEKCDLVNNVISYLNKHYNTKIDHMPIDANVDTCTSVLIQNIVNEGNAYLYSHDYPHHLIFCRKSDGLKCSRVEIIIEERCKRALNIVSW